MKPVQFLVVTGIVHKRTTLIPRRQSEVINPGSLEDNLPMPRKRVGKVSRRNSILMKCTQTMDGFIFGKETPSLDVVTLVVVKARDPSCR